MPITTSHYDMTKSSVGPALPPELVEARKRKREAAAQRAAEIDAHCKDHVESKTCLATHESEIVSSKRTNSTSLPTALDTESPGESDDDVGPRLPNDYESASQDVDSVALPLRKERIDVKEASARPSWMLEPPKSGELARNYNPLKSRSFASKTTNHVSEGASALWTSIPGQAVSEGNQAKQSREDVQQVAYNERQKAAAAQLDTRGPSLYEQHGQKKRRMIDNPDDPSKRPFDREKDIGSNTSLRRTKDFVDRSKDMKSMFTTGSFL